MNKFEELSLTMRSVLMRDQQAFGRLVVHYTPLLRRFFAMQMCGDMDTADDLTQDTLLQAWSNIGSFRMKSSFGTWLYRIACNCLAAHMRRRQPEWLSLDEELTPDSDDCGSLHGQQILSDVPSISDNSLQLQEERCQRLADCMAALPPAQRLCLTMRYMQELSVKDIARATGLKPDAIRANISRARRRLKQAIVNTTNDEKNN